MVRRNTAKITKRSGRLNIIAIIVIMLLVLSVIFLNVSLFYSMINDQAELLGREQLDTVSNRLQIMLKDSEIILRKLASESENLMQKNVGPAEMLRYYTVFKTEPVYSSCKNIYIAGDDWIAAPDFDDPNFVAKDRVWYQGAKKKGAGNTYISSPYLDVITGSMCFSISILLEDGETVVGVDFGLDTLQTCIGEMSENGRDPLIVSSAGQIVAYSEANAIGEKLSAALPKYTAIFRNIVSSGEKTMYFNASIAGTDSTVYYNCIANEWYLISVVSNSVLYMDSYFQLIRNSLLSLGIVAAVVIMYAVTFRSRQRTEKTLVTFERLFSDMSAELRAPMKTIARYCEDPAVKDDDATVKLRGAAINIENILTDVMSAASKSEPNMMRNARRYENKHKKHSFSDMRNKLVMVGVIVILTVTMAVSIVLYTYAVIGGGDNRMAGDVNGYVSELNIWITEQKSTVDMFAKSISASPELLSDYDRTVTWLNRITRQYDDISVTYMANPEWEHTVVMNNGWEPDKGWLVEERQWYIDTMASEKEDGFNISTPYFDEQTGLYCVTFSERVYDMNGSFLGVFAADFYLDKLIDILGKSYSDIGYAFLIDSSGRIINHPNKDFELSADNSVSIEQAGYIDVIYADKVVFMTDYDGARKAAISKSEPMSNFNIICIRDAFAIYGEIARFNTLNVLLFIICIGSIIYILYTQMKWQKKANELLREAADTAERAGKAKSQFLAQMSHEIRTPINAVLGMNEMILRESGSGNIIEYSENIQNAGRTLLSLINSILDFSKIEDGKMEIVPVNYDTASMINDLVNMIQDRAVRKGLELRLEIDPRLPKTMYGDDVRLRQVITNLLTNAVKYTDTGTVWFRMVVQSMESSSVILHVEVEDTGIGIREEDMNGLFSSFQRLDLEKNRNVEGTGLGMSIVTKLLVMMKSELKVTSVYGEGSRFWFDIMQGVAESDGIGDYTRRLAESRNSEREGMYVYAPDARVLIVDDNNMNLMVAKGLMKRTGMRIDTALSGNEGIKLAGEHFYDIIFLDHMMPELDGIETLDLLKERGLVPKGTAIVMMTANAIVGAKEEYLNAGFDDYLSKPIDVKQMEKLLSKFIPAEKLSYRNERGDAVPSGSGDRALSRVDKAPEVKVSRLDRLKLIPELDIAAGLRYCMNDEGFYTELVRAYIDNNRLAALDTPYDPEDPGEHRADVIKVMNASRSIGAASVAKAAKELADVLAGDDSRLVREKHRDLLKSYRRLLGAISNALK